MDTEIVGGLLASRSGDSHWADRAWREGAPAWAQDAVLLGAIARLEEPDNRIGPTHLQARAKRLLKAQGDRGWSAIVTLTTDEAYSWLVHSRHEWPATITAWPEEYIRTIALIVRESDSLTLPGAVTLMQSKHSELKALVKA